MYDPFAKSILVNDPTKSINTPGDSSTSNAQGLWSQINSSSQLNPILPFDPNEDIIRELQNRLNEQAISIKLMRLKILGLEGKFTQEEMSNIRKMLMSEDEASRTLADSIIENG
jgi:hypothetical protein